MCKHPVSIALSNRVLEKVDKDAPKQKRSFDFFGLSLSNSLRKASKSDLQNTISRLFLLDKLIKNIEE